MKRLMMFVSLLFAFMMGTWAQRYYVIYYDDASTTPATRHYLSISENGKSVVDATTLSLRSYWMSSTVLSTAQGNKGVDLYYNDSGNYEFNQNNRKPLRSYLYSNCYLDGTGNQSNADNGKALDFKINTNSASRWLFDNEISETPVYFSYHYKHYIYYEKGWKYSSKGYEKSSIAKIKEVSLLDAPFACDVRQSEEKLLVSLATEYGGEIYYTIDGSSPNTANSQDKYDGPFEVDFGCTITALAVKNNEEVSAMAKIVVPSSLIVTLNDLEDHTWNYYQEGSPISSPHPRNVKITYCAGGINLSEGESGNAHAAVGKDVPENSFVYEKTLESKLQEGKYVYPYTTIANPFSKRPSRVTTNDAGGSSKQFYGFAGWKVTKMEGCTIKGNNGTIYSTSSGNNIIPAETELIISLTEGRESAYETARQSNPTLLNHISAELGLEAIWEEASVVYCSVEGIEDALSNSGLNKGTYEMNFVVVNEGSNSNGKNITRKNSSTNKPATIMMVEPDGSADYRIYDSDGAKEKRCINAKAITLYADTKFEYLYMDNNSENTTISAGNKDLIFGRGVACATADYCANEIRGINSNYNTVPLDYQLRIESGFFYNLTFVSKSRTCGASSKKIRSILGSDYDRSKNDDTKLKILNQTTMGTGMTFSGNTFESSSFFATVKSGTFNASMPSAGTAAASDAFYISMSSNPTIAGSRTLIIEGGTFWNIAGGVDENWMTKEEESVDGGYEQESVYIRMKGGIVKGCVYGGGAYAESYRNRRMIFTGGTVGGWIAGGCNGTKSDGGKTYGSSQIYVGGSTQVTKENNSTINGAGKGQVFGAGKGYADTNGTSGEMTYGTTVVVADNARVAGDVYGGGFYGYAANGSSNVYVLGGTIGGTVYGGSNMKGGAPTNVTIAGGAIQGNVYGGSNTKGEIAGTEILMSGGSISQNIFGGGNQAPVGGNSTVTITGGTVTGNVYGGGNQAEVSGTTKVVIGSSGQ